MAPRGEDAFAPADSLCRLQRLQATCGSLRESQGVDALLFIGGIDGRDNLGSVRCLNFLLGGVGGHELLEREQCVGRWGEDVVLLVRPDRCEIHVGHAHYEALRPYIAAWGAVDVHTLPPRHIPNEDDEAPKRPDREDDDDEASSDESLRIDGSDDSDEEEEEEEDVLQDFKLTALVTMLTGVSTVGVACTPNGPGVMETEKWPLLQAYGIEGVGRSGFFTMSTRVVNTWSVVHAHCFAQLDGAQLRRELTASIPPFRQHWEASLSAMDARRAPGRMTLTPAVAFDPLCEFFTYGTLRTAVGFKGFDDDADAPRIRFGLGTEGDVGAGDDLDFENTRASSAGHARGAALHCVVEARHPKSPGIACSRTYVFGQGCVTAAEINGFTKCEAAEGNKPKEAPRESNEADIAALMGLYAAAVAAGRDAMAAACDAWTSGCGPETWSGADGGDKLKSSFAAAGRDAFKAAANALGVPSRVGSDRASELEIRIDARDPSNAHPVGAGDRGPAGANVNGEDPTRGGGVSRCIASVRVALRGVCGVDSGEPLGAVVYGDSFVPGGVRSRDGRVTPLVLTSSVPLVRAWPADGAETEACEGARDATKKIVKDARLNFRKRRLRAAEKRRAARKSEHKDEVEVEHEVKTSIADDEVFLDDELDFESEGDENAAPGDEPTKLTIEPADDEDFFALSEDEDDADTGQAFAPLTSRYVVDESLALGPSLLVPKPEPVLAFVEPGNFCLDPRVFDVVSGDDGARRGEWHVFDNGVAFVPDHGVPVHLAIGANVGTIDIHDALVDVDGAADYAAGPICVFRLTDDGGALAPSHLFRSKLYDKDAASTSSIAFSLATLGEKSKRHFNRVVVPRWRRVAAAAETLDGCEVRTGLGAYAGATPSQAWACGRARSTRERAGGIAIASAAANAAASAAHKRFQTREPDSAVLAAAGALVGKSIAEASSDPMDLTGGDELTSDDFTSDADVVDVTLLTGAPDGCQDDVFESLREYASGSAAWIECEVPAPGFGPTSIHALAATLTSRVAARVHAARDGAGTRLKKSRVCLIARTYAPPGSIAGAVREALRSASTSEMRLRLGAVTACVAADGFFADAERSPAFGALAQVTPPAVDNVIVLPSGAASSGNGVNVASISSTVPAPTSQELLADASAWIRAAVRSHGGDVNVTVGTRRLLSSPLAAATTTGRRRDGEKTMEIAPCHARLLRCARDVTSNDVAWRRVAASGDVDLDRVVASVRGLFASGRRAPPKTADELQRMTPNERLAYDLTRFLELDPKSPTVMHAEIVATLAGGDARTVRRVYNSTAAAPFSNKFSDKFSDKFAGAVATDVQINVSGRGVGGDGLDLAGRVRSCAHRGPQPESLMTTSSLSEEDRGAIATRCKEEAELPDGWYYDGAVYVSYDGLTRTDEHPRLDEYVAQYVKGLNDVIVERNAVAEEARNALRGVTVTADEVTS